MLGLTKLDCFDRFFLSTQISASLVGEPNCSGEVDF
jgi:hypothetical protein